MIIYMYVHVCYGVLKVPGEIFENLLQLKRFGLHFEGILCRKWLLSYKNKDISCRGARGFRACSPRKFRND